MVKIPTLQQLLEAGVHFGHQVRRGHPKMGEYIFGVREGVHIINLEQSEKMLKAAAEYVYQLGKSGQTILFVGTKKQAQPIIKELAAKIGAPYVDFRWMGGTLTNYDEIRKNVRKLIDLADKKSKGELSHYTKKEQLLIARKLEKFDRNWGGVAKMDKIPDAIFLTDCVAEKTAVAEAIRMALPIVAIADTNSNPLLIDYPIPSNDDATKAIRIITETIVRAYEEGLKAGGKTTTDLEKAAEPKKEKKAAETEKEDSVILAEVAAVEEEIEKKTVAESERVV